MRSRQAKTSATAPDVAARARFSAFAGCDSSGTGAGGSVHAARAGRGFQSWRRLVNAADADASASTCRATDAGRISAEPGAVGAPHHQPPRPAHHSTRGIGVQIPIGEPMGTASFSESRSLHYSEPFPPAMENRPVPAGGAEPGSAFLNFGESGGIDATAEEIACAAGVSRREEKSV